jgi:hypothetical protein
MLTTLMCTPTRSAICVLGSSSAASSTIFARITTANDAE